MLTYDNVTARRVTIAYRAALTVLAVALAACADDATAPRSLEPTAPSFGKNVSGSNQRILFGSDRDGNSEIYSMNTDGTGVTRLTNNPAIDEYAVWSPDGKRIAFASSRNRAGGLTDIYVMNADGTNPVRVTDGSGYNAFPSWSKDGKQLAFTSTRDAADPAVNDPPAYELYTINVDGSGVKRLTFNSHADVGAVFSPDGRQIAFLSDRDNPSTATDLYVMNVDGTKVTRLTNQSEEIVYPSWDSHSNRIAFSIFGGSAQGIYVVNRDGTGLTPVLTDAANVNGEPSWSADDSKLSFTSMRDGHPEIYSMFSDGTAQTRLTNTPWVSRTPRWSR